MRGIRVLDAGIGLSDSRAKKDTYLVDESLWIHGWLKVLEDRVHQEIEVGS